VWQMSIPIKTLQKIETISAFKVLVYLYEKSHDDGIIRISMNNIADDSGIPRNSVKRGLQELLDKNIVEQIATGHGNHPSTYKVSKIDIPKIDMPKVDSPTDGPKENYLKQEIQGYRKAVGARIEDDCGPKVDHMEKDNIINNIIYKDFKEYNLYHNDINSISLPNDNHKLNDEQLGKLARRVLIEWFLPLAELKTKQKKSFYPQQMKLLKDLLVMWRTDQVLAGIYYWTKVNPPKNGLSSVMWMKLEKKNISHMMIALDYFKQQFIKKQGELEEEVRLEKVEKMKAKAIAIAKEKMEQKAKVDEMSANDFLNDLLGGVKLNLGGDSK
jgi:hypothetical protein